MQRLLLTVCVLALLLTLLLFGLLGSASGAEPVYHWESFRDGDQSQVKLMRGGDQVGAYRHLDGSFAWRLNGDHWSADCEPPIAPPACVCAGGVTADQVRPGRVMLDGVEVSRKRGIEALAGGPSVPDDSAKEWLVAIGPGREQVTADWQSAPELAPFRDRIIMKSYAPDHWAVRPGFKAGSPAVYVLAPSGLVLSRSDSYAGPAALARALRKADPSYDPARDPDLARPPVPAPPPVPVPDPLSPLVIPVPQPAPQPQPVQPSPVVVVAEPSISDLAGQVPPGAWSLIVSVLAGFGAILLRAPKGASS